MLPAWCGGNNLGTILNNSGVPAANQCDASWYGPTDNPGDNCQRAGIRHRDGCLIATLPGVSDCCDRGARWWRYGSRCGKDATNAEDYVGAAIECFIAIRARPYHIDN